MRSRMDRYKEIQSTQTKTRSDKNQELYQSVGTNKRYTNFTDVTNANAYDLSDIGKSTKTRENYQKMKEYNMVPMPKVKKELEDFNSLYQDHENKIYDINSVLQEARKNRVEKDALEERRKLKNTNYNILANLNPEELEKYRKEKKEKVIKPNDEEIRELIDTITSKTLAGEIDKATSIDLLSDLMATNVMDKVEKPQPEDKEELEDDQLTLSKEILDKEQIEKMQQLKEKEEKRPEALKDADTEFYTRSMDLSDKDFDLEDEFKEKKIPIGIKIFLIIIIIAIVAVSAYFIYQKFF